MLQYSNKLNKSTTLLVVSKSKLKSISTFTANEKKFILDKNTAGLNLISLIADAITFYVAIVEDDKVDNNTHEKLRILGCNIFTTCKEQKEINLNIDTFENVSQDVVYSIILGISLSNYEFLKYKKDAKAYNLKLFIKQTILDQNKLDEINLLTASVIITKDLVNEPVSYLTAIQYSKEIQKIGKEAGFKVTVWNQHKIEKERMGGLVAVNKGSSAAATFNILEYKPVKHQNKKPLVLVGKGVVYDTGGLSLKPTKNSMDLMKCDMAGSATVVGAMYAIAKYKLPYYVIGLIPAVENRPGYEATCPGDIITMYDGTTVEVLDTDAEGRLILADALHYAKKLNPELVLDFATLTGSAMRAIGKEASVIMGTANENIKNKISIASAETGERIVEFPLWDEYAAYMKSDIADLKNLGPAEAGSITAGKFLEHFTDYPWMHFDIAGPAFVTSPYNYRGKWATAYGVRLLFKFIQNQCENDNGKK